MRFALTLRRFLPWMRHDRRGGIALMFALLALPLIGLVGLSIDVGFTVMAKSRMALAADAAALAAARTAANIYATGGTNYVAQGQATGVSWFNGQAGTTSGLTMGTPVVVVTQSGGVLTANLTYSGSMATTIARVFGFSSFAVNGNSTATITVGGYADINVLMDISSSMGIAATNAGITSLGSLTLAYNPNMAQNGSCAFGCHWSNFTASSFGPNGPGVGNTTWQNASNPLDFYQLARQNGIQLRIDVLISAVQSVISQLITQNANSLYRIGLYSFNTTFNTIYALSGNLTSALSSAQNLTVPLCCGGNGNQTQEADTNYPLAMQTMTTTIGVSGTGATTTSRREFLFLVTDGVSDYCTGPCTSNGSNRVLSAMTPDQCSTMKANGVTILVLYTNYIPLNQPPLPPALNPFYNGYYVNHVYPFSANIVPDLTACASAPEYFFQATDPTSIQTAMQQMLQIATSTEARFTQ